MSPSISASLRSQVRNLDQDRCAYCQTPEELTVTTFEVDHITPSSAEGETTLDNLAAFRRILADQVVRYPRLEVQDLYKLVFQAALGSEHAVRDAAAVRGWLERELREMGAGPTEPVVEPLSPDERIVRVNLRPYIAAGGDPQALLEAFIHTANAHRGTSVELRRYWGVAEQMAREGQLPFSPDELRDFIARMEALGLPAVHHSEAYEMAYRPAYRVIARELLGS